MSLSKRVRQVRSAQTTGPVRPERSNGLSLSLSLSLSPGNRTEQESHPRLRLLRAAYRTALNWRGADLWVVDFLAAWAVSNRLGGRQAKVWGFLVGPSGVGKTEAVFPFYGLPFVYPLNTLTDKSMVSGLDKDDGVDHSNLPKMDKKLVIMPEFTTIIQMPHKQSNVIMADLRSIYDGIPFAKDYGTVRREYDVSFGLLACVTPVIDDFLGEHTQLGERFLMFRLLRDFSFRQEVELLKTIRVNAHKKERWRRLLKTTCHESMGWLQNLKTVELQPPHDPSMQDRIQAAAQLVTRTRSVAKAGENIMLVDTNAATRMIQQLQNLGAGRVLCEERDYWNQADWRLVRRVAEDSLSREGFRILRYLWRLGRPTSSADLARATGVPATRCSHIMQQWRMNELTRQTDRSTWTLSPECLELMECAEFFQNEKENKQ